jgi:hypothetical protein
MYQEMCLPAELSAIGDTPTKFCAPKFPVDDEVMPVMRVFYCMQVSETMKIEDIISTTVYC